MDYYPNSVKLYMRKQYKGIAISIYIMANRPVNWEQKAKGLNKERAFAWAMYYEEVQRRSDNAGIVIRFITRSVPRNGAEFVRPETLPTHITNEMMEMAEKLNREFSCPCCFDLMNKETIHIAWCGHYVCRQCYGMLSLNEHNKKSCPTCRKNI